MSQALALAEARRLQTVMGHHGVPCTIELMPGRAWAGDDWYSTKRVHMNHHTAGSPRGLTPSYGLCRTGDPSRNLPGPLCNGYGGRDHVYRIVTMGLANHPGTGGPLTVDGFTIPKDSARISCWGTEWEHDGVSPWPAGMREFMARSNAAILRWGGLTLGRSIEHSTWTPRKIDRNGYTALIGQAEARPYLLGEVMAQLDDEDKAWLLAVIREAPWDYRFGHNSLPEGSATRIVLADTWAAVQALRAETAGQAAAITALATALQASAGGAAVDPSALLAAVREATTAGVEQALGDVELVLRPSP